MLKSYDVGKPIIIEETFPLNCGLKDYRDFLERSREMASGWFTFYWGKTLDELNLGVKGGIRVILIKRGNDVIITPDRYEKVQKGDILVVSGKDEQLEGLRE